MKWSQHLRLLRCLQRTLEGNNGAGTAASADWQAIARAGVSGITAAVAATACHTGIHAARYAQIGRHIASLYRGYNCSNGKQKAEDKSKSLSY